MSGIGIRNHRLGERTCEDCEGTGIHIIRVMQRDFRETCPICNGLGYIYVELGPSWLARIARAIGLAK